METSKSEFGLVKVLIVVTTLITALIHLYLNVMLGQFSILFTLNGLGYLGLLGLLILPIPFLKPYRPIVRWVFLGFALLTLVLWFVMNGTRGFVGYTSKIAEAVLVVCLFLDGRKN